MLNFPFQNSVLCQNIVSLILFFLEGSGQQDVYKDVDSRKNKL